MAKDRKTRLLIVGMRDNAGRERIALILESVPGVKQVDVSLFRVCATVVHAPECQPEELLEAVAHGGFEASLDGLNGLAQPMREGVGNLRSKP